jgi:hypothetical protein
MRGLSVRTLQCALHALTWQEVLGLHARQRGLAEVVQQPLEARLCRQLWRHGRHGRMLLRGVRTCVC